MVDYQEGADALTAITLLNGVTIQSGFLDNPGDVNTIAVGGTIPFTAYGVYSDGVTRPVSNHIFYEGPCNWASSNNSVMTIDSILRTTPWGSRPPDHLVRLGSPPIAAGFPSPSGS